jgi:hypothetical protein
MKALSNASTPASEGATTRRSPAVQPQQREQFESALRRHQRDPGALPRGQRDESALRRDQREDESAASGDACSQSQAQPLMAAAPTPALPERPGVESAAAAMPRTAAAQDAVSTHLRALGVAGDGTAQAHWQLQWSGATTAVQQVDVRRTGDGRLHLDLSGSAQAGEPARLARLRDRVAARVAAPDVLVRAYPASASGPVHRRHADEDESNA